MSKPRRSSAFYRAVLAIPIFMLAYLVASGRAGEYFGMFGMATRGHVDERAFHDAFTTGILWMVATVPALFAAWEIGREHTTARRMGFELFVGIKEVFHRAFRTESASVMAERDAAFARPPRDNPRAAALWGVALALLVPTFFASFAPDLRSPKALVWLGVMGILVGLSTYCRQRSLAYLREEPGGWAPFRGWSLLNPARYDEGGRIFVRWQIALSIALPIWWLGVGAVVLWRT